MARADRGPGLQSSKRALGEPQTVQRPLGKLAQPQPSARGAQGKGLMLPVLSVVVMSLGVGVAMPPHTNLQTTGVLGTQRGIKAPEPAVL